MIRVTRLGEFLPIGRLFSLDSFGEMTEIAPISRLLFSTVKVMYQFMIPIFSDYRQFSSSEEPQK
jgi:hypothetical protein